MYVGYVIYPLIFPAKKSFYRYALFLAVLDLAQAIGSTMLYCDILNGMWYVIYIKNFC